MSRLMRPRIQGQPSQKGGSPYPERHASPFGQTTLKWPALLPPPSKHARKKPVKARGLKEAAAKQATSKVSARKGEHAAQGKENHPSGMAGPVSAAS